MADFLVNSTDVSEAELQELREAFKLEHYPTLKNLENPYDVLYFKDGTKENGENVQKALIVAPIKVSLHDITKDDITGKS